MTVSSPRAFRLASLTAAFASAALSLAVLAPVGCTGGSGAPAPFDGGAEAAATPTIRDAAPPPADTGAGPVDCATDRTPDGLATHLECSDLYEDFATKTVAPGTRPFTPGLTFWSDGADKQRYIYLPPGSKIDISNFDEWQFPVGTRTWKQFKVEGKLIETRLFMKTPAGWKRTTYRWNADETSAVRMEDGEQVPRSDGGPPYEIPKGEQCDFCHAGRTEPVLGFQAIGLGVATAKDITLATLAAEGSLSSAPPATSIVIPDDPTGLAAPAVGWLHANCGHCHNDSPNAGAFGASLKMLIRPTEITGDAGATADDLAAYRTGYCKPSERDAPGGGGAKFLYIAGGSLTGSLAAVLLGSRAVPGMESIVTQMPPIVTHIVDSTGQKQVDDWITALPACP